MDNHLCVSVGPDDLSGSNLEDVICFSAFKRSAQDCYETFVLWAAQGGLVFCLFEAVCWILLCLIRRWSGRCFPCRLGTCCDLCCGLYSVWKGSEQMPYSWLSPLPGCSWYLQGLQHQCDVSELVREPKCCCSQAWTVIPYAVLL